MNGKNGSIKINIPLPELSKVKRSETEKSSGESSFSCKGWIHALWEFCKEDRNRVTFSIKVGLAVLLVSFLILFRAPYQIFGTNIIWSILTVAIMFEYTVGATFNRGFNRALGSLLAGVLAVAVAQVALYTGHVAEPIIIGFSIFIIGALGSFMKQWPSLVPYEYGFRVIIFTYCLIIISGYRMGNPVRTAMDRLYSIAIGGFVTVLVSVLVWPAWAGEQLHKELVKHFDAVADSLQECVRKYLEDDGSEHPEFSKTVMDEFPDEPAYKKFKATLNSSATIDSLANSAKWEPPHGRFKNANYFFYPWSQYVTVGSVLRSCAYEVMALHGVLHSEIQAPYNLKITFQSEIQDASNQAAELVRNLGKDIMNMKRNFRGRTSLLKRVHSTTLRLQRAIYIHSYLLTSGHESLPDNSCSAKPLSKQLSHAFSATLSDLSAQLTTTDQGNSSSDGNGREETSPKPPPPTTLQTTQSGSIRNIGTLSVAAVAESYQEGMKKHPKRQHSWPSREVDEFEEGSHGVNLLPKMKALDSTASLSLATFTSLLIEFVARLDHLVEAVDELAKMAKFKLDDSCN
ncbi:aluminum-activated malate transporter 9-like [Telopea speciosissima]|uniref:aluminum-activated malate transporter 9-like n=1 Tax=Telopea speciosissima TaxID=54955 RepID=UPI001CC4AD46|nr:aluminum-activated malate transporter 9-like [Telopea speciosissima]